MSMLPILALIVVAGIALIIVWCVVMELIYGHADNPPVVGRERERRDTTWEDAL